MLVEGVTDYAIYMLDPTGTVVNWNPGAQRIKGYEREEIIGQHFSRFYTEEDRQNRVPYNALKLRHVPGNTRPKVGASVKMEPDFGRAS